MKKTLLIEIDENGRLTTNTINLSPFEIIGLSEDLRVQCLTMLSDSRIKESKENQDESISKNEG